jgi:putative glutathione S-transferase
MNHVASAAGLIREARPDEYAAAEDLAVAAFTTGCWVSEAYEQGLRRLRQRAETWHIWVAAGQDGNLLGVVLTPRVEFWTREHFTFSVLATAPAARGSGLGSALTDHAIGLARAHGFRVIEINSSPQMSAAHHVYYAKGFTRRPERETSFASPYDERLLTFTYHIPDPLPASQVRPVERRPAPGGGHPLWREPARGSWPDRPPGTVDSAGAFIPASPPADAVQRAERVIARLAAQATPEAEDQLIRQIVTDLGSGALTALWSPDAEARAAAVRVFFARLDTLDRRLARGGPFLTGQRPGRADVHLFSVLLAYDLGWRAGFAAWGAVADWPHLWHQARLVLGLAELTAAESAAAGLTPGRPADPFGPLPEPAGLDVRAGWLEPPAGLRRRRPPRDPSVPVLPYVAVQPGPAVMAVRDRLARTGTPSPVAETLDADLLGSLERLLRPLEPADSLAIWRLFWARVDWLNARLKGRQFLEGDQPGPADAILAAVFDAYPADLRDFPRVRRQLTQTTGI